MSVVRIKTLFAFLLILAGLLASAIHMKPAHAAKAPVYTGLVKGVGAGGYDVVAYFTQKKPVRGTKSITQSYQGVQWRFSSVENKNAFAANPEKYVPQYGGYCALAVSRNYTAKGDPKAWRIHDGKLYLNFNKSVRATWAKDIAGNVAKGNRNWPSVLRK